MIFVTVGSALPFDRLIRTMDDWASRHPENRLIAQIGDGAYRPSNMEWLRMVPSARFASHVAEAELVVAHAGTGSVLAALQHGKPMVLVPRYADCREHTTDHQLHTANWLRGRKGVVVAERDDDIDTCIEQALEHGTLPAHLEPSAPADFLARIRAALV